MRAGAGNAAPAEPGTRSDAAAAMHTTHDSATASPAWWCQRCAEAIAAWLSRHSATSSSRGRMDRGGEDISRSLRPIPAGCSPGGYIVGVSDGTRQPDHARGAPRLPEQDASLYLHPQTLARLKTFELRAKMIVEGVMSGQHRSPYRGFSVEFAQHRPYVAGDDVRHLDWKVYARSDKLHLKQYQQETNLDLIVMVDASGSMNYGSRSFAEASGVGRKTSLDDRDYWSKFDHATAMAAALSYITLRQGDRVGVIVFADEVVAMLARTGSMGAWRQVIGALSTQPVARPTNLGRAIDQMIAKFSNRCLIALVSDFFEDPAQIRAAMARVKHKGHDLMAFQVLDRAERDFEFSEAAPFEGLEGEGIVKVDPRAVKAAYLDAIGKHIEAVEKTTRGFGFDYQLVDTHDWLGPPLAEFVARRNARIKRSKYG